MRPSRRPLIPHLCASLLFVARVGRVAQVAKPAAQVRARLQELDAGAPVRAFTTVEEMTAAADADRAVRRVA